MRWGWKGAISQFFRSGFENISHRKNSIKVRGRVPNFLLSNVRFFLELSCLWRPVGGYRDWPFWSHSLLFLILFCFKISPHFKHHPHYSQARRGRNLERVRSKHGHRWIPSLPTFQSNLCGERLWRCWSLWEVKTTLWWELKYRLDKPIFCVINIFSFSHFSMTSVQREALKKLEQMRSKIHLNAI